MAAPAADPESKPRVRIVRGYLMVVSVKVNDRGPYEFLVDTGTNTTLLDPALPGELALVAVDRMMLNSMGHSLPAARYYLSSLRVGGVSVSNLEALAAPLPLLREVDSHIRGVLGMNFLLQFSFLLDYDRQRLEIYRSPESARAPEGTRVQIEINDWRLLIPAASPASPRGVWKLSLDSGASELLIHQDRIAPSGGGIESCVQSSCVVQVSSNHSRQSGRTARVSKVQIDNIQMRDVPMVVLAGGRSKSRDLSDGLLPASMFRAVFFDRGDATVVLSPRFTMVAGR